MKPEDEKSLLRSLWALVEKFKRTQRLLRWLVQGVWALVIILVAGIIVAVTMLRLYQAENQDQPKSCVYYERS